MRKRRKKVVYEETPEASPHEREPVISSEVPADPPSPKEQKRPPRVSILERRLLDPRGVGSETIQLREGGMALRWVNTAKPGRYYVATSQQGWEPVRVEELEDPNAIADLYTGTDNYVRRGERGQEILMKMPLDIFQRIQMRKVELNLERERKAMKETVAQAAANRFGPEAGDYIAKKIKGEILESTEKITVP